MMKGKKKQDIPIMKFFAMLFFVICISTDGAFAQDNHELLVELSGDQLTKLHEKNASSGKLMKIIQLKKGDKMLQEVLQDIANQTGLELSYSEQLMPLTRIISIKQTRLYSAKQALWKVLEGASLRFGISPSGQLFFFERRAKKKLPIQVEMVTGQVMDVASGEPLPGVNVMVKGTTTGTSTDSEGQYELNVPSLQDTLVYSFIGFLTQEVPINGRTNIDVELQTEAIYGEELVVVGYGEQQRSDITGAISSVSSENINEVPVSDVSQALQGQAAGVRVQTTSARPGAPSQIRIRGSNSLTASNDPLIVLDGVPFNGSLKDLNTDMIQSLEVLKDASATAIYGSRGANGVLLITSKKGESGQTSFSYNAYQGINTVARKYDMMSGPELLRMEELAGYDNYTQLQRESIETQSFRDWQDVFYKDGAVSNHQLTISGGTENSQYSLGGGYRNETTVYPGVGFERYSFNVSLNQDIGDRVNLGFTSNNTFNTTRGNNADIAYDMLFQKPYNRPYNEDGSIRKIPTGDTNGRYNPLLLYEDELWEQSVERISNFNTLYGEVQILEGLKYRLNVGASYWKDESNEFYARESQQVGQGQSEAALGNSRGLDYSIDNLLYYDTQLGENHNINVTALYGIQETETYRNAWSASDMVADFTQYYNLALSKNPLSASAGDQDYVRRGIVSYMGRVNYRYQDRYLITLTGRADGSSVLSEGNKWHYYPAVALGWNVINESFMGDQDFISELRVRLGYGETSNQSVAPYQTLGSLSQKVYNFGSNNVYGYSLFTLPNENISWEFTRSWNAGIDFGFFNGRLSGSFELYRQTTTDILVAQQLPPSSGIGGIGGLQLSGIPGGSFLNNVGEVQNQGIELYLSSTNFLSQDGFNWSTDLNFSLNRNEILSLASGMERDVGNGWFVGQPIDVIYDYDKVGIWQLDEADEAAQYGMEPGTIKLADHNNNGRYDGEDRRILGALEPGFEIGLNNRFSYKGIDLSIIAFASIGGKLISPLHQPQSYLNQLVGNGQGNNLNVDYWTPDNPTNKYPKPRTDRGDNPLYGSTLGYFNASFLKIRSITLGYNLPVEWVDKIGGRNVRIYANVKDLPALFSPYVNQKGGGVDPEPTGFGNQGEGGQGDIPDRQLTVSFDLPPIMSANIGVNIDF